LLIFVDHPYSSTKEENILDLKVKFILTIDTEADNQWDYSDHSLRIDNIKAIPEFQKLCDDYGVKPTYLVTSEIALAPLAQDILGNYQQDGKAEIGAHLHPWTTEPFAAQEDRWKRTFVNSLPNEIIQAKIENLTHQIERGFGKRPTSYRAGRFGFNSNSLICLEQLGYLVDCSITPLVDWSYTEPYGIGPDFRRAPTKPYYPDYSDICNEGAAKVLEVPVTILFTKRLLNKRWGRDFYENHKRLIILRGLRKVIWGSQPLWFRPLPNITALQLIKLVDFAEELGLPVVEMLIHSSELMPGGSPYNPDRTSVDRLFKKLETLFAYMIKNHQSILLTDYAMRYKI
jgi:hypothetical protein